MIPRRFDGEATHHSPHCHAADGRLRRRPRSGCFRHCTVGDRRSGHRGPNHRGDRAGTGNVLRHERRHGGVSGELRVRLGDHQRGVLRPRLRWSRLGRSPRPVSPRSRHRRQRPGVPRDGQQDALRAGRITPVRRAGRCELRRSGPHHRRGVGHPCPDPGRTMGHHGRRAELLCCRSGAAPRLPAGQHRRAERRRYRSVVAPDAAVARAGRAQQPDSRSRRGALRGAGCRLHHRLPRRSRPTPAGDPDVPAPGIEHGAHPRVPARVHHPGGGAPRGRHRVHRIRSLCPRTSSANPGCHRCDAGRSRPDFRRTR